MSQVIYHRDTAGEACGPGIRSALSTTPGTKVENQSLDAVGDTWNHDLGVSTPLIRITAAGTWSAYLFISISFGNATVNTVIARYNGSCVEQEKMVDEDLVVSGSSSTLYTFSSAAAPVVWQPGDLMMCILTRVSGLGGPSVFHFNQQAPGDATRSRLVRPDEVTGRPWYVYANSS